MVVTIYLANEEVANKKEINNIMDICPFDISGVQLLTDCPVALRDWAQEKDIHIYNRTMNKKVFGRAAVFKVFESMIEQSGGVVFIGLPSSKLDRHIIECAMKGNKSMWIKN